MNTNLLDRIACWLEAGGKEDGRVFHMGVGFWNSGCRTVCCVAGAACDFVGAVPREFYMPASRDPDSGIWSDAGMIGLDYSWGSIAVKARDLLGLDDITADELFEPDSTDEGKEFTPAWAARCIRKLMATGVVDWDGTRDAEIAPAARAVIDAATAIQEEPHEYAIA